MPTWLLPILVQVGEALAAGVVATVGALHVVGASSKDAFATGIAVFIAKLMPSQVVGPPQGPAPKS